MIRNSVKYTIYDALNYDIFRFEDFKIVEGNQYSILNIYYDEYFLEIDTDSIDKLEIVFSPGVVMDQESTTLPLSSFENKIVTIIRSWLLRIKRDLLTPIQERFVIEQLDKFRTEINEKLKDMDGAFFSVKEGEQLKEKLDELEASFDQASQENEEIRDELEKLKAEINFLRETINTMSKKKWLGHALTKLITWGQKKENQMLIKSGFEAVEAITQIDMPDVG